MFRFAPDKPQAPKGPPQSAPEAPPETQAMPEAPPEEMMGAESDPTQEPPSLAGQPDVETALMLLQAAIEALTGVQNSGAPEPGAEGPDDSAEEPVPEETQEQ